MVLASGTQTGGVVWVARETVPVGRLNKPWQNTASAGKRLARVNN